MFECRGKAAFDFVIIFIIAATTYNITPLHAVQEKKTISFSSQREQQQQLYIHLMLMIMIISFLKKHERITQKLTQNTKNHTHVS